MRYVLALLLGWTAWTAPTFAQDADEDVRAGRSPSAEKMFQYAVPLPGAPEPFPSSSAPVPPAFHDKGETQAEFLDRERRCLATAIYFEGRGWPVRGKVAIGQVILNRVRSPLYPQTICGVVYEDQMTSHCQFHFTCDGISDAPRNDEEWALAAAIAKKTTEGELWLPQVGYATKLTDPRVAVLAPVPTAPKPALPKKDADIATGTGFVINDRGDVVTNNHVVERCSQITFVLNGQAPVEGRLVAWDGTNDLAVANFQLPHTQIANLSDTINNRPGDDVVVFGYPLLGLLSSSGNLTRGSLTAMSGLQDDVRYMQISAPVQPGNSGGPVLDLGGEVIGVVTYKLNAIEAMKASGDVPQNVNFALKASILRLFLDSHSIPYRVADTSSPRGAAEVGSLSEQFTGIVICAK